MNHNKILMTALGLAGAVLMSLPFLIPHCGLFALFGLVPLLCMERIGTKAGIRRVWLWHYGIFVLWNALTTFWVCNATVGGGLFAIFANALQMSLIFGLFRFSRKAFKGVIPYIFLVLMWIAWERMYFDAQISWPWLVLGNSFARTVSLVQWYEYTGVLGGSLWIWAVNLGIFALICAIADGDWQRWNGKARMTAVAALAALVIIPAAASIDIYHSYKETDRPLDTAILQPNIDPYHKFQALSQDQQNAILEGQIREVLKDRDTASPSPLLILAPETFTADVNTGDLAGGRTFRRFNSLLSDYPGVNMIVGASSWTYLDGERAPSHTARPLGNGRWYEAHNSALMIDGDKAHAQIFHKNKLVVGVEMTPWPAFFCKVDDLLGGVMGRCVGDGHATCLNVTDIPDSGTIPVGTAICYESVYGEYCTEYVRNGAQVLAVITNDAWWGNTPGYRQHLSYASLRAIETRRDIVRSANTGISAIINQRGDIVSQTAWWEPAVLEGRANLNDGQTFYVRFGDRAGRFCTLLFLLMFITLIANVITFSRP